MLRQALDTVVAITIIIAVAVGIGFAGGTTL